MSILINAQSKNYYKPENDQDNKGFRTHSSCWAKIRNFLAFFRICSKVFQFHSNDKKIYFINLKSYNNWKARTGQDLLAKKQEATINVEGSVRSIKENISPLDNVNKILSALASQQIVVIHGAPCSGKSQLLDIALPDDKKYVFDLSKEFLKARHPNENQKEALKCYGGPVCERQSAMKKEQLEWLHQEKESIIQKLASQPAQVVVFDEIDFRGTHKMTDDEENAVLEIVKFAKELTDKNKKVVFVIHSAAKYSEKFNKALENNWLYTSNKNINMRFFTDKEELHLLSKVEGTPEQKREFMQFAMGSPIAYLPIFGSKPVTLEQLKQKAPTLTNLMIQITKHIIDPQIWTHLEAAARGEVISNIESNLELMTDSGLVGKGDKSFIMPGFIRESLLAHKSQ